MPATEFNANARFPFLEHPRPIALAHRGGAEEGPENTMAAFAGQGSIRIQGGSYNLRRDRGGASVSSKSGRRPLPKSCWTYPFH